LEFDCDKLADRLTELHGNKLIGTVANLDSDKLSERVAEISGDILFIRPK